MSGVLVLMEQRGGVWNRMSFEALAAGQQLAAKLGIECSAAVIGEGIDALAAELTGKKLTKVFAVQHALLKNYTSDGYVATLEKLIKQADPAYVVLPHTYQVRDFAPALATRFSQALISDVIAMHDGPVFVRQLLQGKLNADYKQAGAGPCFVSIQAGTFRAEAAEDGTATVETFTPQIEASQIRGKPGKLFREAAHTVDLSAAQVIVSVGRGIGEQE
ncbi:MAG: electron transfer flavoprotein subunit alpha/FixB family protein, partial [Edaphobacter sp.]